MDQDVELFCKDLGATVRQTVDLARGVEENCFIAVQNALPPAPWIAELNSKAQSCVEQQFGSWSELCRQAMPCKRFSGAGAYSR